MVSSSMPSANAVARAWNAAGREWVDEWGFSCFACGRVDTLPPKTTVRYCLDPKLIPVPKELPDA